MANDAAKKQFTRLTLRFTDLAVPEGKKAEFEKAAEEMADMADSFGYLDPLDEELSVIFNPEG
ncbi:MAG: hypothetical protein JRG73_04000 [Deltaproteobacteria bacterium]|nr:hypothetical protein [Deltaproteobacteria bacterium]